MKFNDVALYGALIGMVLLLTMELTAISADPRFIAWYYLKGGRIQVLQELQKEVSSYYVPTDLSEISEGADFMPYREINAAEIKTMIRDRAKMRYNETLAGGAG